MTVGTGIGAGIILDGQVYRGVEQAHPEIGHHLIDPSGPLCDCGFQGCWESLAAGPAMVAWLKSNAPREYSHRAGLTAKKICELAQQGDSLGQACRGTRKPLPRSRSGQSGDNVRSRSHRARRQRHEELLPCFWMEVRKVIASSCRLCLFRKTNWPWPRWAKIQT